MGNLIEVAKEKLTELTENASNLLNHEVVDKMKDYGLEKLNDAWAQIESSTDVFQKTGYSITTISLNLSIPPTLNLSFDQIENISDEAEEKLLEENKDRTFLYPILIALFRANAVQKSINSVSYKFSGLSIGVGLSPSIDMKFAKVK